jgi:enolase-phosphatase E1
VAASAAVRALLLDVEGTTTPVEFVYGTLFPYARAHLAGFVERHRDDAETRADLERLREEHASDLRAGQDPPPWRAGSEEAALASALEYLAWLMDRDRKSPALKSLQGRVWREGYRRGELRGEVYPDVPRAFERWRGQGRRIAIFSSGSVLAQRLLFGSAPAGDLTRFIEAHFDTSTGAKVDAASYARIAAALGLAPADVLFLSDAPAELDAARAAGLQTSLCVRGGEASPAAGHPVVRTFDEVCP